MRVAGNNCLHWPSEVHEALIADVLRGATASVAQRKLAA